MRGRRTADEGKEETRKPDGARFLPLRAEDDRIELGSGEKSEHNRAETREELDPGLIGAENRRADRGANDELRDRADNDLGQRRRNPEPDGKQAGDEGETDPQRRERPDAGHSRNSPVVIATAVKGG